MISPLSCIWACLGYKNNDPEVKVTKLTVDEWKKEHPVNRWKAKSIEGIDKHGREILDSLKDCTDLSTENTKGIGRHLKALALNYQEKLGKEYMYLFFQKHLSEYIPVGICGPIYYEMVFSDGKSENSIK